MLARFRTIALGGLIAALFAAGPAQARADEPLPRFEDAVCPGVVGLKRDAAETVVGMIRVNAEALGLPLANEQTCEANVVVAFIDDGADYLNRLVGQNSTIFFEMDKGERERILAETGDARAVLRVRARSRDGMPIPRRENMTDIPIAEMWGAHSKIYTATRNDILSALVLIDRKAVTGLSLQQLADYATLRAFTHTLPPASARGESIVSLFDEGADRPAGLTDFDHKFLGALYEGLPNLPGSARLAALEAATGAPFTE
ncbi:hypothetical protein [Altererythrobacter sp. Root672]|uniref:hypothetical protein n=1 Tax=Altererythrobacter sp. Root672 TaxID=1736584 RepID=UPI0006F64613|nr:hypothetical protein [Altererythrobacter sp. Root672]KRA80782.1 hypothetical protein ASD76_16755 [Altererythrobacter sp. Root672]